MKQSVTEQQSSQSPQSAETTASKRPYVHRDLSRKPACPEWCLTSWCEVRPSVDSDGKVLSWHGWHIGEMRTVDIAWGAVAHVALAAPVDDPENSGVYLRLAAHEDGDQFVAFMTGREADALQEATRRTTDTLVFHRQVYPRTGAA